MDAESISFPEKVPGPFPLLVSNAAFQWFQDPGHAIDRILSTAAPGSRACFAWFTAGTYCELAESLDIYCREKGIKSPVIPASGFKPVGKILEQSSPGWKGSELHTREHMIEMPGLADLLRAIRDTGEYGPGLENGFVLTPGALSDIEKIYRSRFGRIKVSYKYSIFYGERA